MNSQSLPKSVEELDRFLDEGYDLFSKSEADLGSGDILSTLPRLYNYVATLRGLQNRISSVLVIAIRLKAKFDEAYSAKKIINRIAYAEKLRTLPAKEVQSDGKFLRVTADMKKQMVESDPEVLRTEKEKLETEKFVSKIQSFIDAGTNSAKKLKESSDDVWKLISVLKYQMMTGQVPCDFSKISEMGRILKDEGVSS